MEMFRGSKEYVMKLSNKAAEKMQGTYFIVEEYLKTHLDGNFDGFIDFYLEAEARKSEEKGPRSSEDVTLIQAQNPKVGVYCIRVYWFGYCPCKF